LLTFSYVRIPLIFDKGWLPVAAGLAEVTEERGGKERGKRKKKKKRREAVEMLYFEQVFSITPTGFGGTAIGPVSAVPCGAER